MAGKSMGITQNDKSNGFTIVELLIVIVVIGILAAITIVAYNGIQNRSKVASLQADITNGVKVLESYKVTQGSEQYPTTLATANVKSSPGTTFTYYYNGQANSFCLEATNGDVTYSLNSKDKVVVSDDCTPDGL
ncbi:MAG: prepilin-type N-terminal cleavage/methylation domain-containing protein, partial [Candidatus Microsaccharimonas sp.]